MKKRKDEQVKLYRPAWAFVFGLGLVSALALWIIFWGIVGRLL